MKRVLVVIIAVVTFVFAGCETEPVDSTNGSNQTDKQIEVSIRHFYENNGSIEDSALAGVEVILYETEDLRSFDLERQKIGQTDSTGKVLFHFLSLEYYFVRAWHPVFDFLDDEVSTPDNAAKSFLEIDYVE